MGYKAMIDHSTTEGPFMAFDSSLAERIRHHVRRWPNIDEKKMFGGIVFLLSGNILVGVWQDSLIVRIGPDHYEDALQEDHVTEFDVTGKPMKGWLMVLPDGIESDSALANWIDRAAHYVDTLPIKWQTA